MNKEGMEIDKDASGEQVITHRVQSRKVSNWNRVRKGRQDQIVKALNAKLGIIFCRQWGVKGVTTSELCFRERTGRKSKISCQPSETKGQVNN